MECGPAKALSCARGIPGRSHLRSWQGMDPKQDLRALFDELWSTYDTTGIDFFGQIARTLIECARLRDPADDRRRYESDGHVAVTILPGGNGFDDLPAAGCGAVPRCLIAVHIRFKVGGAQAFPDGEKGGHVRHLLSGRVRVGAFVAVVVGFAIALAGASAARSAARGSSLCVASKPGCYSTIQAAVNAAHDGDTIRIAPGSYAGGVQINLSVNLVGAGAPATIIRGGGPVILIGEPFPWSPKRPTVTISGVTVTGGVNSGFPDPPVVQGGGISIQPSAPPTPGPGLTGAIVTIRDSIVTGNQAYATDQTPPGFCGPEACAFADGGGIDNAGMLTLINTRVTDNLLSSPPGVATSLGGGGIDNHPQGTLALERSWVTGNRLVAADPNGREGNGGGISSSGTLSIEHSFVNDNVISISSSDPTGSERDAFAGGIFVDCCGAVNPAIVAHTQVRGNRVSALNVNDAFAFGGGIVAFAPVSVSDSSLDHNAVSATSTGGGFVGADGGGGEFDDVTTLTNLRVDSNTVSANSPGGTAFAQGGGLANAGQTTMTKVIVVNNSVTASGASGAAQGGGVWNGTFGGTPTLTIQGSSIVHNSASASPGLATQGGGLYSDFPLALTGTNITANLPDQCFGC